MAIALSSFFPLASEGVVDRTVFGSVVESTGAAPASAVTVTVKMEALDGTQTQIGTAQTDPLKGGAYSLSYNPDVYKPVILRVSLEAIAGTPTEVIVSPAWNERVDFKLGVVEGTARAPRYTDVASRLSTVLTPTNTDIATLDALGVARLALASGVHPKEAALARDAKVSGTLSNAPQGLFYGLGRGGLSGAVADVVKHSPADRARALDRAIADGTLSAADAANALAAIDALDDVMIQSALTSPTSVATPGLALDLAGVTNAVTREAVLQAWLAHTGDADAFWSGLNALTPTEKTKVQFALQLDHLTRANAPLVSSLFATYASPAELASLELTGLTSWTTLVGTYPAPQFLADAGVDGSAYAAALFKTVEDAFPTPMLSARSGLGWFSAASTPLATFINNNGNFLEPGNAPYDLAGMPLREFLHLNPNALAGALPNQSDQDALKAELPILERLYRIAPRGARFEVLRDLRAAGIASATQIQLMGRARFMAVMGPTLGAHADSVYRRARALSSAAVMLHLRHRTASPTAGMAVLPIVSDDPLSGTATPVTWAELFGGRSFCACSECQSAHGPAAYLADLLFWLRSRDTGGDFLGTLLARRPDLGTLELSCKNTNTPLPTIDLVLEQLENLLAPEASAPRQTTLDADELAARPEHVNEAAYARLAGNTGRPFYPFDQPYVAALDQTRTFLKALGVDRSIAMMTMLGGGPGSALDATVTGQVGAAEIAAEILGMTRASWAILAGDRTTTTDVRWGLEREIFQLDPVWTPVDATVAAGIDDPDGGKNAVTITDDSSSAIQAAVLENPSYPGGALRGSLYIKKAGAAQFAEIRLGIAGDYSDATRTFALDLVTGAVSGGSAVSPAAVEGPTGWWSVSFAHAGAASGSAIGVKVSPAAGTSVPTLDATATGSATVYAPQIAAAGDTSVLKQVTSTLGPSFLGQAGDRAAEAPLTYADLEDLLCSQYVQDAGQLAIWFDNHTCDISGAALVPVTSATFDSHLDRLSKLIRLQRDLGWSVRDVDRAIMLLGASDITEALLLSLGAVRWLERALGKAPAELLNLWGPLDTRRWRERLKDGAPSSTEGTWDLNVGRGRVPNLDYANAGGSEAEPSPFQRLVRLLKDADAFAVADDGSDLEVTTNLLADHLSSVAAIAGVDPRELDALVASMPAGTTLTLHSISAIYRRVSLARALGLSTTDTLDWKERLGADFDWLAINWTNPDAFGTPIQVVRFAVEVKRNATVRLSKDALDALLDRDDRDLTLLGLPSSGVALLALADEVRANQPVADANVFDSAALDDLNLLPVPAQLTWDPVGSAALTTGVRDPSGRSDAATLEDSDNGASLSAQVLSGALYTHSAVWASVWVKKDPGAAHFAEIGVIYDVSGVAGRIGIDLATGETHDFSSFTDIQVRDAGDWWFIAFKHAGDAGSAAVGLIVYPAAGTRDAAGAFVEAAATIGSATVYGARIAEATGDAADPLYPYAARDRAIVRRTAALLNLDVALVTELLNRLEYRGSAGNGSAFERLLESAIFVDGFRGGDPRASASPDDVEATLQTPLPLPDGRTLGLEQWQLVAVAGWLCRAFALHVEDLPWLLDAPTGERGFDIQDIVFGSELVDRYAAWAKLRDVARLQQVADDGRLFDLFDTWRNAPAPPDYRPADLRADLAARTNWTEEDLHAAIKDAADPYGEFNGPLGGGTAASWADPDRFTRLAGWMELARALQVPAASLLGWGSLVWGADTSAPDPVATYEDQAREAEHALRGVWGRERWLSEMPAIRENLRNRQRHGLLSRIVGDTYFPELTSSDAVGQKLLMDVQMGACARTSRLKDALRTVQAFVARVLLGEEDGLRLEPEEAEEWAWRKNFRVWEANRKVFLYPENWLRPELRRDKTPFFTQLEADLSSGDLREELVEDAYRTYLRKLADVSKLETLALLTEERDGGAPVQHVFARTRAVPYAYFHRELVDGNRWTAWREIPKVEGEHLLPVVYQRRLMLFWLNISDTALEPDQATVNSAPDSTATSTSTSTPAPNRYFNIRLSWSEFRDGRWSGATKSDAFVGLDERGRSSGADLSELISCGPPGSAARVTYATTVIHADIRPDSESHDLLIRLFREAGWDATTRRPLPPITLQRFRMSSIDGHVIVESGDSAVTHSTPPALTTGGDFGGRAQRFFIQTPSDLPIGLQLPVAHASAPGAARTPVLERPAEGFRSDDWIQITAPDRVRFDSAAPFVFEDNVGSYWVTYKSTRFFGPIGFGGWYWPGSDLDLRLSPPRIALPDLGKTLALPELSPRLFKSVHTAGTDALVDEASVSVALGSGKQLVAINGSTVDKSAKNYTLSAAFQIADDTGTTVLGPLRAAAKWDREDVVQVVKTFEMPLVTVGATLTTEGFHFLWPARARWRFDSFFHPHVGLMRETLNRLGVFGLIDPPAVSPPERLAGQNPAPETTLEDRYVLSAVSHVPPDDLDFSASGAYAQYNWELFFHAPFLIASRLHEAGKFDEALKWLRTIFDPFRPAQVGEELDDTARSFWRFRPFREQFASTLAESLPRNIQEVVALLTAGSTDDEAIALAKDLLQQIADWRRNPFDPHAIARTRIITYMTSVVMKYLEVLIDWGDQLFAQDTLESIGEAAEYYLLAARILGPKPEQIDLRDPEPVTFNSLVSDFLGGVGPASTLEEALAVETWEIPDEELEDDANSLASLLYFCVPANPELRPRFWDRVADRLFKIRNCMDIQGRRRELALFEPPIDPDLLVRAAAAGADLRTMLAEVVTGRVPHRRYLAMAELAAGLAASAQGLGQALLVAIEKRDADQLATLRNQHERRLQEDAIAARREQITDIQHQLDALRHNRAATARRLAYYKDKPRTNAREALQLTKAGSAKGFRDAAAATSTMATILGLIPDFQAGTAGGGGTPLVNTTAGGRMITGILSAGAHAYEAFAGALEREGAMLLTESGYDRRKEEWRLQEDLAQKDLDAIDARLLSMEIQLALARSALSTAELRMTQIEKVEEFLERRFARDELYDWLQSELTSLHYQSYRLAYEFAKKAERAWQYELGCSDIFIQFGYWDSGKRGLLAADKLGHDLRRMQVAYTELSTRRLEVEQTFSLRDVDPYALVSLRETGATEFTLPEALFDLYYPGQFGRRIRAVRLTVPTVVPPNTNVPAHLEILRHWIRKDDTDPGELSEGGYGNAPVTMTATSSGQRDGGVFELDFRGPRLLPFEGAGAVSKWRLRLPKQVRSFRYRDIQDVLVHVAYDAQYSGTLRSRLEAGDWAAPAYANLFETDVPRRRVISLRQEYGGALRKFIQAAKQLTPPPGFSFSIEITDAVIPAYLRDARAENKLSITNCKLLLVAPGGAGSAVPSGVQDLDATFGGVPVTAWPPDPLVAELPSADIDDAFGTPDPNVDGLIGTHTFTVDAWGGFKPADDFDILIAFQWVKVP